MTSTTPSSATNNNNVSSSIWTSSAWKETQLLLNLAIPTVVIQLGGVLPNFLVASYVGRNFGAVYLDGFTLASLMGNLCNLSLLQGLYSSSDTLGPQAFGAGNNKEVGLLAMRGFIASLVILAPINLVLFFCFSQIMVSLGEDVEASKAAHQWYQIYACGLPFYALYMVAWKFLSAQEIMQPLVVVCIVCLAIVLPLSLEFFTNWLGFLGSAWAIFVFQVAEAVLLIGYLLWKRPHTPGTWPGLHQWREALQWVPLKRYFYLGMGGMLATSEWIYWEFLSLLIGTLGVVPLSVHTVPTQVVMVGFMFPFGIGIALAVRLGATLPKDVKRAQRLTIGCFCASTVLFAFIAIWMYVDRRRIFSIFTSEPAVLEGCERIWWKVAIFYFNLSVYGINTGIATGLGMQWRFGIVTFICLWGFSLPGMYYWAIVQGGGLDWAWSCIYPPYIAMNVYFVYAFWRADWEKIRIDIRIREGMDELKNFVEKEEELVQVPSPNRTITSYGSVDDESLKLLPKNGH
jgi:MATE family multidrug resistance protein